MRTCRHVISLANSLMSTLVSTVIHLKPSQLRALQEMAKAHGTNVSEEIRDAVDSYLAGMTAEEIQILDVSTKKAEAMFVEMRDMLEETNHKAERIFREMAKLRGAYPEGTQ